MPIATPEVYAEMLDRAKVGAFAYPAINVTSSQTLNAALKGFAEAESDGICQVSTGGAEYLSGQGVKNMVEGACALAEFAHSIAKSYKVNVALHTDHCPKPKLDAYMRPLVQISQERVKNGQPPLFQSHMWDGSAVELEENLAIADELLERVRQGEDHYGAGNRRRGRRGGRRRRGDEREALHLPEGHAAGRRRARPRGARAVHAGGDLRQRARCLQARACEAASGHPQGRSGLCGRAGRQDEAVRPGLPRRQRLARSRRSARPSTTAS